MNKFLTSNKATYRIARTIVQAILGWFVDNLAMLVAQTQFSADIQIVIVSICKYSLTSMLKFMLASSAETSDVCTQKNNAINILKNFI